MKIKIEPPRGHDFESLMWNDLFVIDPDKIDEVFVKVRDFWPAPKAPAATFYNAVRILPPRRDNDTDPFYQLQPTQEVFKVYVTEVTIKHEG